MRMAVMKIPYFLFSLVAILSGLATHAHGALLVYEGFNYSGSVSNGASMGGVTSSALGLTGNYAVTNSNSASSVYNTSGLSFGSNFYSSTGGALQGNGPVGGSAIAGVAINATSGSSTLWNSYLFNFSSLASNVDGSAVSILRLNTSAGGTGTTSWFSANPEASNGALAKPGVAYDSTVTNYTGAFTLATNTTYLAVARYTNVGTALSAGSPGTASLWIFTQSGYDNWVTNGASEANLSVYASATVSDSATTGTFSFSSGSFLQLGTYGGTIGIDGTPQNLRTDEIRFGTTLYDVVVPEPSISLLVLGAGGFLLIFRKRPRLTE